MLFVRLFELRCLVLSVSSSCLGTDAVCDCGTPWTFHPPPFLTVGEGYTYYHCTKHELFSVQFVAEEGAGSYVLTLFSCSKKSAEHEICPASKSQITNNSKYFLAIHS